MAEHVTTLGDNQGYMAEYIRLIESFNLFVDYGITTIMYQTYKTALSQCSCSSVITTKTEKLWGKFHSLACQTVKIYAHNSMSKTCNPEMLFKLIIHLFNASINGEMDALKRAICSLMVHYLQIYFRDIDDYTLYIRDITRRHSIQDHGISELKRLGLNSVAGKIQMLDPSI